MSRQGPDIPGRAGGRRVYVRWSPALVEPDDWIVLSFKNPAPYPYRMIGFWGLGFGVILNDD